MTKVYGTLKVVEAVTLDSTLYVKGDTKIAKFACNNNNPQPKQTAIPDTSSIIPKDDVIANHTGWTDAKDDVEKLRDAVYELQTKLNGALAVLRTFGFLDT